MDHASTCAVMFADVAGSTALYERIGDRAALARIAACLDGMREIVARHHGRVVKNVGDGLMIAFPEAGTAARAAIELQASRAAAGDGLSLRVGFHAGSTIERDSDLFGDAVNLAARIGDLAKPGQILTTIETVHQLPGACRAVTRPLGSIAVKGKALPVEAHEVVWDWSPDVTMVEARAQPREPARDRLLLEVGEHRTELAPPTQQVTLGRDAANDVVVPAPRASRQHARVEFRNGKFVLVDFSSNGTFLRVDGERDVELRREAAPLRGSGWIFLGAASERPEPGHAVRYSCA